MKWELSDETAMVVSGVGTAFFAVHALSSPRSFHDLYMEPGEPYNATSWRWFGHLLANKAASDFVLSASDTNKKAMKNSLKVSGVVWATSAAHMLLEAQGSVRAQKPDVALYCAIGQAAIGALCLWRGFSDDDKKEL